ncbi:phosphatidylinositol glycan, class S [Kwoniella heveanensis CBS 569]|nr:phosphatidylinositol glycan, class S [Kwoniella heveanensis CBS 569]
MAVTGQDQDDPPAVAAQPRSAITESSKPTPKEVTARINPSSKKRLSILLSFPILFLLAIPFWWYTTSIERLPLPTARIDGLGGVGFPELKTKILLTGDQAAFPTPPPGKAVFELPVILQSLGKEVTKGVDGIYERQRPKKRRTWELVYADDKANPAPLRVHIRRFEHANISWPLEPYVQPPERGLMTSGIPAGTLVIPVHPDQVADRFLKQHYKIALINSILSLFPDQPPSIPLRALKYSPNITLSFVLLNEDASEGSYVRGWDIEAAVQEHILPHLEPLKDVFNFTIESQLLYHAPLTFEPTYQAMPRPRNKQIEQALDAASQGNDEAEIVAKELIDEELEKGYIIDEEMMKVFVNSEKWSLDSGSTNNPVLRFLVYVPKETHRPMRLSTSESAQSFLLPQFGGVVLLNPPSSLPPSEAYDLPLAALAPSVHLFTQHLYSLLALPTLLDPGKIHPPPPASPFHPPSPLWQGITPWQVYQVYLSRGKENAEEAIKTLVGIKRLVAKIREMKVGEGVRGKVNGAVERLEKVSALSTAQSAVENFILTRDAVGLANRAFFDPSMMGLLYFPDEHKFAVYTPLFAPIAVPLILGLLKELIAWRKRRRSAKIRGQADAAHGPEPGVEAGAVVHQVDAEKSGVQSGVGDLDDTGLIEGVRLGAPVDEDEDEDGLAAKTDKTVTSEQRREPRPRVLRSRGKR